MLWLPALSELLCLWRRRPVPTGQDPADRLPGLVFLVPAHNEEVLINQCVRSLTSVDYPAEARRIMVIADNCSDSTALLARKAGADCLERSDPTAPGKPQAIVWALRQLPLDQWDAVVIVDADTVVTPGFARGLAQHSPIRDQVLQANFLILNEQENWLTRLGGLLSRCRYEVSYPLKEAAGINCPLTGNGMCIGTGVLARFGWKAFSITEDSELYAQYTLAGVRIHHARAASLYSQEASSLGQGTTQRRRWLAGRLWVLREYGGQLLRARGVSWHQKLDVVVELGLSSPVLHAALALGAALLLLLSDPWGQGVLLAGLAVASLGGLAASTASVLRRHPRPGRLLLDALHLPIYFLWRIAVVIRTLFTLGDRRWARTQRSAADGR